MIPANHFSGAKTQSSQPISNKQQPNYNTNNLNDTYK